MIIENLKQDKVHLDMKCKEDASVHLKEMTSMRIQFEATMVEEKQRHEVQLVTLNNDGQVLRDDNAKLKSNKRDLEMERENLSASLRKLEAELINVREHCATLSADTGRLEGLSSTLSDQLNLKNSEFAKLLDSFSVSQASSDRRLEEVSMEKRELQCANKSLTDKLSEVEVLYRDIQKKYEVL